jgi:hypothetical protein
MKLPQIFALASLLLAPLAALTQHRYIDIDADSSTMGTKHDVGTYVFYPSIASGSPLPSHASDFRFLMLAHPGTTTPGEKMLINLVQSTDSYAPAWDTTKTVGFAVRLGSDYRVQSKNLQLCEWWQGSPYGAVVELILLPGTTTWAIGIENDERNTQPGSPGREIILPGNSLKLNTWYRFELAVKPSYSGHGTVEIWQDGRNVIQTSAYVVGYDPSRVVGKGGNRGLPMKGFDVEVGVYRPANNSNAEIYFDSIRWGDMSSDVR